MGKSNTMITQLTKENTNLTTVRGRGFILVVKTKTPDFIVGQVVSHDGELFEITGIELSRPYTGSVGLRVNLIGYSL